MEQVKVRPANFLVREMRRYFLLLNAGGDPVQRVFAGKSIQRNELFLLLIL